jgi:uncharacterized protein YdhG (YjbR/CyaY superfamily)
MVRDVGERIVPRPSKTTQDSASAQVRRYLASQPAKHRAALRRIRAIVRATAPKAIEHFSYGIPGFRLNERPLVWYAAFKRHVSLYPLTAPIRRALANQIAGYETSTGTIRLPLDAPLPVTLIRKIVKVRAREARDSARAAATRNR